MKTTNTLSTATFLPTLPIGSVLTLELRYSDQSKAFGGATRLIGFRDKKYILLETPSDPELNKLLIEPAGLQVVVRGLTASRYGEIFALKSHILSVLHRPEKMVAIALPPTVSIHRMREFPRFNVSRIITLDLEGQETLAKLTNFSLGGCAIRVANHQFIDNGELVRFTINGLFEEPVMFEGEVKSVAGSGEGLQLGLEFREGMQEQVYDTLAKLILTSELSEFEASLPQTNVL